MEGERKQGKSNAKLNIKAESRAETKHQPGHTHAPFFEAAFLWQVPPPQIDKRPFIEYFLGLNQVNDGYISSFTDLCTMVQITGNITYHE